MKLLNEFHCYRVGDLGLPKSSLLTETRPGHVTGLMFKVSVAVVQRHMRMVDSFPVNINTNQNKDQFIIHTFFNIRFF